MIRPADIIFADLKKEALYFDRLVVTADEMQRIVKIGKSLANDAGLSSHRSEQEFRFMLEERIVCTVEDLLSGELHPLFTLDSPEFRLWMQKVSDQSKDGNYFDAVLDITDDEVENILRGRTRKITRTFSESGFLATSIYLSETGFDADFREAGVACLSIVLHALPTPSDTTPWAQIVDFKNDPDSQRKLRALRDWQNDVTRSALSPNELAEKLAYLLDDYAEYIRLQKMKSEPGTTEMILTTGADIIESLIKLKPSKAINALYSFRKRKLDLLEAELKAPGREVAFIHKARHEFGT